MHPPLTISCYDPHELVSGGIRDPTLPTSEPEDWSFDNGKTPLHGTEVAHLEFRSLDAKCKRRPGLPWPF